MNVKIRNDKDFKCGICSKIFPKVLTICLLDYKVCGKCIPQTLKIQKAIAMKNIPNKTPVLSCSTSLVLSKSPVKSTPQMQKITTVKNISAPNKTPALSSRWTPLVLTKCPIKSTCVIRNGTKLSDHLDLVHNIKVLPVFNTFTIKTEVSDTEIRKYVRYEEEVYRVYIRINNKEATIYFAMQMCSDKFRPNLSFQVDCANTIRYKKYCSKITNVSSTSNPFSACTKVPQQGFIKNGWLKVYGEIITTEKRF